MKCLASGVGGDWCGELRVGMVSGRDLKKTPETKSSPSSSAPHFKIEDTFENAECGEKPNKCNQFDYASSQAGHLKIHLKIHSG